MKMYKLLIPILCGLCIDTVRISHAQTPDSCLRLYCDSIFDTIPGQCYNPDSVKVDTCISSPTYGQLYAKKWFRVYLKYYIIDLPQAPSDTVLEVSWTAIDTSYSVIRAAFATLESKYGPFVFKKLSPHVVDSSHVSSKIYELRFDYYVCVDSVLTDLKNIDVFDELFGEKQVYFERLPNNINILPNDKCLIPNTTINQIQPSNPDNYFPPYYHKRGWQWNLYSIKAPMAWEITKGLRNVVVGADDWFHNEEITNPDISYFTSSNTNGNWMLLDPSITTDEDPQYTGDGIAFSTEKITNAHGATVLPLAVAFGDNEINGGHMIGVAFNSKCIGVTSVFILNGLDVDNKLNSIITHIDVANYSYTGGGTNVGTGINLGIVQVASAGNERTSPYSSAPANIVVSDPNDPTNGDKDVKVISVAALEDGTPYNNECIYWDVPGTNKVGPQYIGAEMFGRDWNFSPGTDKFNNNADQSIRKAAKSLAHVDVVAPSRAILTPMTWDPLDPNKESFLSRKYHPNIHGTSQGSPTVAGVVALMMSTNSHTAFERLGINMDLNDDNIIDAGRGRLVHQRAYNIITFTADKLQDVDNISSGFSKPVTFDYTEQTNDPLHRTWAQRMGFGKVNAYRAVAHSIPHKGYFEYTGSHTLAFNSNVKNEDNKQLMHWGAYKDSTSEGLVKVLEHGGISLPSESHNNQGLTLVNAEENEPTVLTVTNNRILAIDGIVRQTDETKHLNMIQATGTGKILIEGMLDNVALKGTLKIGDVIVNSTADVSGTQCGLLIPQGSSEIYGNVRLMTHGNIKLETNFNTLYVMPGGKISVEGDDDFTLGAGTRLTLISASSVKTSESRSIIVESGAYLNAGANSGDDVEIDGKIIVKNGGTLSVTTGCTLRIKDFVIEKGGTIKLWQGARLILTRDGDYVCNGHFISDGTSLSKVNITAREGCPYPVGDDIVGTATIIVEGEVHSDFSQDASSFDAGHTNFENVIVKLIDVQRQPIYHCTFKANPNIVASPDFLIEEDLFGHILYIYNIEAPNYPKHSLMNAELESCIFEKTDVIEELTDQSIICGVLVSELSNSSGATSMTITNCSFTNYPQGVTGINNGRIKINTSDFTTSSVSSNGTPLLLCSNDFADITASDIIPFGVEVLYSVADIYDNIFTNVHLGVHCYVGDSYFRGNTFRNYSVGIQTTMGNVYLSSVPNGSGQYKICGRNTFEFTSTQSGTTYDVLIINIDDVDVGNANAYFRCGYNDFNSASSFHVGLNSVDALSTRTYDGTNNKWRGTFVPPPAPPIFTPRVTSNITITGTPFNQSLTANEFCGVSTKSTECYTGTISGAGEESSPQPIMRQDVKEEQKFIDNIRAVNNPFNNELNILIDVVVRGHYHLHVFDALGKVVHYNNLFIEQNQRFLHQISTNKWTSGSYYVRLSNGAETKSINVIK